MYLETWVSPQHGEVLRSLHLLRAPLGVALCCETDRGFSYVGYFAFCSIVSTPKVYHSVFVAFEDNGDELYAPRRRFGAKWGCLINLPLDLGRTHTRCGLFPTKVHVRIAPKQLPGTVHAKSYYSIPRYILLRISLDNTPIMIKCEGTFNEVPTTCK